MSVSFQRGSGIQHRSSCFLVFVIDSSCAGFSVILDCISKLRESRVWSLIYLIRCSYTTPALPGSSAASVCYIPILRHRTVSSFKSRIPHRIRSSRNTPIHLSVYIHLSPNSTEPIFAYISYWPNLYKNPTCVKVPRVQKNQTANQRPSHLPSPIEIRTISQIDAWQPLPDYSIARCRYDFPSVADKNARPFECRDSARLTFWALTLRA